MNETTAPTRQMIEEQLATLNQAQKRFYAAKSRIEKDAADMTFQDSWDWLREHGIKPRQQESTQV